jgi:hypothetical protein
MFNLDKEQLEKLAAWKKTRPKKYEGCSGGRYIEKADRPEAKL